MSVASNGRSRRAFPARHGFSIALAPSTGAVAPPPVALNRSDFERIQLLAHAAIRQAKSEVSMTMSKTA